MSNAICSSSDLFSLLPRYVGSAPRYTSYPTAVEFSGDVTRDIWLEELQASEIGSNDKSVNRSRSTKGLSLYFHLPFCHSLCYFCACSKVITRDYSMVEPYLQALCAEVDSYGSIISRNAPVEQIHWGGGTPNFFNSIDMKRLMEKTIQIFPNLLSDADISVELDPRTTSRQQLEALKELGINRISLGVQDFRPEVQQAVNRIQPYEMTRDLIEDAREIGLGGVNVDLIYGLPNQTVVGFLETIDQIISIKPDRIALYGYAHVTWIKKVQKALERAHLPTAAERIEIFTAAIEKLCGAGYEHIGMDHFALPEDSLTMALRNGTLNRNFMGYTTHEGASVIGFGASAISSLPTAFAQNIKDVKSYQQQVLDTGFAIEKGLIRTVDDQMRGEVIESLLCGGEVNFKRFNQRWECSFEREFASELLALKRFEEDGLIRLKEDGVALTDFGRILARNVAVVFDAYIENHRAKSNPIFSQAI